MKKRIMIVCNTMYCESLMAHLDLWGLKCFQVVKYDIASLECELEKLTVDLIICDISFQEKGRIFSHEGVAIHDHFISKIPVILRALDPLGATAKDLKKDLSYLQENVVDCGDFSTLKAKIFERLACIAEKTIRGG